MQTKTLGRTGIALPVIGLGTAFLGIPQPDQMRDVFRVGPSPVDYALGVETLLAALDAGYRYIDTAPLYGRTVSESMIYDALQQRPGLEVTITSKTGRLYENNFYDFDGILRAVYASLDRLGLDVLEVVYIHDAMGVPLETVMAADGALGALRHLQKQGVVKYIGTAANDPATNIQYLETGEFDAAVIADSWSLLNQTALERIFPAAQKHHTGIVVATPIERGLLATGPFTGINYHDRNFSQEVQDHVGKIQHLCEDHGIPLLAAALQWTVRHPAVTAVIPGARIPQEATANIQAMQVEIPESFWQALQPLVQHWEAGVHR